MTSSILMVAFLSIPTFLSFSALIRMSGMQEAAATVRQRAGCKPVTLSWMSAGVL